MSTTPIVLGKAGQLNITVERYATFSLALQFKDKETGEPIDLTGVGFEMQIRENLSSADPIITLTNGSGIEETDLAEGKITLVLTASETADIGTRGNVYDLVATYLSGQKDRLLEGQLEVNDGVTHG